MTSNPKQHIVIIGAGYAGIMTALRLSGRVQKSDAVQITLINGRDTFIERIRLHQQASGESLKTHNISQLLRGKQINFVRGWVTQLDPEAKTVTVNADGETIITVYDTLVYALGSMTNRDTVNGVREYAYTLDPQSAETLRGRLPQTAAHGGTVIVGGGGLTGIEAVTEFAEHYPTLNLHLVTRGKVGDALSEKGRKYLIQTFDTLNIRVSENVEITAVNAQSITLDNGNTLTHDAFVWAGAFTVPELARESGLTVNSNGQILVDSYLRSVSHPDVYAIGDSAQFVINPNAPIRMACATAMPMGVHAGENIARALHGKSLETFSYHYIFQCISLGRKNALVQWVNGDDTPRARITTGRLGAFVKEQICRFTVWMFHLERRFTGAYRWAGQHKPITPDIQAKEADESIMNYEHTG